MIQTYERPDLPTRRTWIRLLPLLVPVAWCGVLLAFMRPDALKARSEIPIEIKWLVYDETDLGALVIRGANAHMGRLPGRQDEPLRDTPEDLAARLNGPPQAYSDRYYLEYPTATLVVFQLGYWLQPSDGPAIPPVVADAEQYAVAHFVPQTDNERKIWGRLRTAARVLVMVMAAALLGLMLVIGRGYQPTSGPAPPVWLAALPGAVFFSLNRFDVVPTLATALGFACLGRGRPGWSGAFMAVGVLLKVYPVLFVPILLRYLGPARGGWWLAGFVATVLAGVGISWATLGWEPTIRPVLVQLSRPLEETSWTLYGRVLPLELGHWKWVRLGFLTAIVLAAAATRPADLTSVLRRCGVVLTVFVALAVFWSPQWVVWFLPILIPLATRRRWIIVVAVGLDLANYFSFPILFWILWIRLEEWSLPSVATIMIYVRATLWAGLVIGLLRDEWIARRESRLALG